MRKVEKNQLMLAFRVPRLGVPESGKPLSVEFKWADNFQQDDSIDAFTLNGDAAPPGRFNYLYQADGD